MARRLVSDVVSRGAGLPRDYKAGLDLARIAAIIGVVAIHVASPLTATYDPQHPGPWWIGNGVFAVTRWTVPVFVMISGALAFSGRPTSLENYYRHRLPRVAIPLVVWTIAYWAFLVLYMGTPADLGWLGASILTASTYGHLYFLAVLLGLALVTPVLAAFWAVATRREQLVIVCLALGLGMAFRVLQEARLAGSVVLLDWWLPFLGLYLAGAWMQWINPSRTMLVAGVTAFLASAALIGGNAWLAQTSGSPISVSLGYSYLGPLSVANSLAAFAIAACVRNSPIPRRLLRALAALVFGVYLLNPMVIAVMRDITTMPTSAASAVAYVTLGTIVVVAASAAVTWLGAQIQGVRRVFV